jgi:hypothetical protein
MKFAAHGGPAPSVTATAIELSRETLAADQQWPGTRRAYVWKVENRRFVPIAVGAGLADDFWQNWSKVRFVLATYC